MSPSDSAKLPSTITIIIVIIFIATTITVVIIIVDDIFIILDFLKNDFRTATKLYRFRKANGL